MKGLDTNVLVRFLAHDHPTQAATARSAIERAEARGERLFVSDIVLCELVWTLAGRRYRYPKAAILRVVESMLEIPVFEFRDRQPVRRAVRCYRDHDVGFTDCFIRELHRTVGCDDTWTFDRAFGALEGVTRLDRL